jgi:hypothetical protein
MKYETRASIYGIMAAMFGLTGTHEQRNPWKKILFRTQEPRVYTAEQRTARSQHRKQNRRKRQARIQRRGFA